MADNDVTVRYLLRDEVTTGLKRMEGQAEATDRKLKSMGTSNGPLLSMFDSLDGKIGNLNRQWDSLDRRLMSSSRTMQHGLLIGLRDITLGLTAAAGAATFFGLKAVNSFQHTQAAFSVLTGSIANGQQLYNQLMALNLKSPFDMQPLASSEQTLLGFGFNQRNSLPVLQNLSNVAAVQQDPNEALQRMSLAVGQINQSGFVRAQDLNQLVQAGLPAYKLIPGGKAGLLDGSGRISSDQFIGALSNANNPTLRPYGGAAQAMNQTLSGQWSNLTTLLRQEAIRDFSGMGNELVKAMPDLTKVLTGEMRDIAPAIANVGADLIKGAEALLPVLEPIVKALLTGLHELFSNGAPFLRELRGQDPAITAALGDFFSTLAGEEPAIAALFGEMVQLLPPFVHALDDAILLVDPVLKLVDGLLSLGPVRTVVADLLVVLLAYRTIGPAIKAVIGMRDAMFGLAAAETAAGAAGGAGMGLSGVSTYRGGKRISTGARGAGRLGKGLGILGGLGLAVPGAMGGWDGTGRGWGADLSTVGGAALIGAEFGGPIGAAGGALIGGAYDLGMHLGGVNNHLGKPLSKAYLNRAAGWGDALMNDPRLAALMAKSNASLNMSTGAIVVHESKDPHATAKAIRDEIERWMRDRQERQ